MRELLVAARRRVHSVSVAAGRDTSPLLAEIEQLARSAGVPVHHVDAARMAAEARTETPQGVVARADPVPSADIDQLLSDRSAFLVALDSVTDPQNVGAVLRAAEATGVTGLILPSRRAAHLTPAAVKAAAGAVEHVPIALVSGIPSALERAARANVWSIGLDALGAVPISELEIADRPLVLVLGSEGRGIGRLTRARCDVVASIPMRGELTSLNVAAAAAIACFEVSRRRRE